MKIKNKLSIYQIKEDKQDHKQKNFNKKILLN
jgi:hypothetical protein